MNSMVSVTGYSPAARFTVTSHFIRFSLLRPISRMWSRALATVFHGSSCDPLPWSFPVGAT